MTFAEQFLVILLSTFLAIFLILSIIVLVKLNKILTHVDNIVTKAELIADQAEHVGEFFQKTAGSIALTKLVANVVGSMRQHRDAKGKDHE